MNHTKNYSVNDYFPQVVSTNTFKLINIDLNWIYIKWKLESPVNIKIVIINVEIIMKWGVERI